MNEKGRSNILGMMAAINELGEGVAEPISWRLYDNSFAQFTRAQFKQAAIQALGSIQMTYGTSWQLEAVVNAATTVEEVEAVVWPS